MPDETPQTGLSDTAASGLAYVTVIPAIIFLVVAPYNQSANVRFHAWQSIFLAIGWFVGSFIMIVPIIGWIIGPLLLVTLFVLWLLCIINAFNGKRFVLPVLGALAAKQAGA